MTTKEAEQQKTMDKRNENTKYINKLEHESNYALLGGKRQGWRWKGKDAWPGGQGIITIITTTSIISILIITIIIIIYYYYLAVSCLARRRNIIFRVLLGGDTRSLGYF